MKIVWATPYSQQSAIARFSHEVVASLRANGHEVAIYRTEKGVQAELAGFADPMMLTCDGVETEEYLRTADLVVVNIGDHYGNHGGVFDLLERRAVVGILHDWCLLGLFWGWLRAAEAEAEMAKFVADWYGNDGREAFEAASAETILSAASQHFPMTEWLTARLMGAVIHSEFYRSRVEAGCAGPVVRLPLAYPSPEVARTPRAFTPGESMVVSTFGIVNPNKCVDHVIRTIAGDPLLRQKVSYRVLGAVEEDERSRLEGLAKDLDYAGLSLEGRVSQARLQQALGQTDVVCCLRDPALEGASASAIEGMQSGAPVIVTDSGFYSELPDQYVLKVPLGSDPAALRAHLHRLLANPTQGEQLAARAGVWASREFSAGNYASGLEREFDTFLGAEPYLLVAGAIGKELGKLGLSRHSVATQRVAQLLHTAFSI